MEYRNSSASQHLRNGAIFGKDSSHGVELSGGSTGGRIDAVGDDADITLTIAGKGVGETRIGNSSSPVAFAGNISTVGSITMSSGSVLKVGSTAPFAGFIRFTSTAVATPDFNTTNAMVIGSSVTITGANSSHFVMANYKNNGIASTDMFIVNPRTTSTGNEVLFDFVKVSTVTVAVSTATINFLLFRF